MPTVDIPLSGKNMKIVVSHTIIFVGIVIALGMINSGFHRTPDFIWVLSGLLLSFVIVLSGLDYADILRFRKSVARLTKCSVCGRKYRAEKNVLESEKTT